MKFKKLVSVLTGIAAVIGISLSTNAIANVPNYNQSIHTVNEQTPVFLGYGVQSEEQSQDRLAAHYSHSSHVSHASHVSHSSHYSSRY